MNRKGFDVSHLFYSRVEGIKRRIHGLSRAEPLGHSSSKDRRTKSLVLTRGRAVPAAVVWRSSWVVLRQGQRPGRPCWQWVSRLCLSSVYLNGLGSAVRIVSLSVMRYMLRERGRTASFGVMPKCDKDSVNPAYLRHKSMGSAGENLSWQ